MKMRVSKQQLRNTYELIVTQYADMIGVGIMLVVFGDIFINETVGGLF